MMKAEELKAIREAAGVSQKMFADLLGLSRRTVIAMETGEDLVARRTELAARYFSLVGLNGLPD